MSLDGYFPTFPKIINEKVWQKKKGIVAVKKTGISEAIEAAEKAFQKLNPAQYARGPVDIDTLEEAEKAAKAILKDTPNIKGFNEAMIAFAKTCESKAAEFKSSKLIPKAVGEFLIEMANEARDCGEKVVNHARKAAEEVEEAINKLNEDKNIPLAKERMLVAYEAIDAWDKLFPSKMQTLENLEKELTLLNKEMENRLSGKVSKPVEELKLPLKEIRDSTQSLQDLMLGKRAFEALKLVKEVRGIIKKIKGDPNFFKNSVDPFETRADMFLVQREKLNVISSNVLQDAASGFSELENGRKGELEVMTEMEKFSGIYYDKDSPNSIEKTKELIDDLEEAIKGSIEALKSPETSLESLRSLKKKGDEAVLKIETSITALNGVVKVAARLVRGRFEKHAMIGNALKKIVVDFENIKQSSAKPIEVYKKILPKLEKAIVEKG